MNPSTWTLQYAKLTFKAQELSLKDITDNLPPLNQFHTCEILCSDTVFIDHDLQLPGVDLIIIAPLWRIKSNITIDLSGEDGLTGGLEGINGLPGHNGQNGGHFIGKATTVIQEGVLNLKVNGGNGGNGADGENGRDGRDGEEGKEQEVLSRSKDAVRSRTKLGYKDGKAEYILESLATFNDRFYTVYTSGNPGEDGQDGGMAGAGGQGGYPGQVKMITQDDDNQVMLRTEQERGVAGQNGQPGKPGRGGRAGGKIYTGVYLEAKAFPSLRNCKESNNASGLATASTATAVTAGQAAGSYVAKKTAERVVYQAAGEIAKQTSKQVIKEGGKTLTKEAAQGLGKEMAKQLANQVGEETLKKAGGSFIQGRVASLVAGTTGGTLQSVASKEAVRGIGRAASSELGKTAAKVGSAGTFSFASAAFSFGLSIAVQTGLSFLHEKLRSGWHEPVKGIEGYDGQDGVVSEEMNTAGMELLREKEDLETLLCAYKDLFNVKF